MVMALNWASRDSLGSPPSSPTGLSADLRQVPSPSLNRGHYSFLSPLCFSHLVTLYAPQESCIRCIYLHLRVCAAPRTMGQWSQMGPLNTAGMHLITSRIVPGSHTSLHLPFNISPSRIFPFNPKRTGPLAITRWAKASGGVNQHSSIGFSHARQV